MPFAPLVTARKADVLATMEKTISVFSATALGVSAHFIPRSSSHCAFVFVRLYPVTECPASRSRFTIRLPMTPKPTKPRFAIVPLDGLARIANVRVFPVAILRVGCGESTEQRQSPPARIDHHVARPSGDENRVANGDLRDLAIDPRLAGASLDVNDLLHPAMAMRMTGPGFFYRQHLDGTERDALGLQYPVRYQLAEKAAG